MNQGLYKKLFLIGAVSGLICGGTTLAKEYGYSTPTSEVVRTITLWTALGGVTGASGISALAPNKKNN